MERDASAIVMRPVVSEKSMALIEQGKYVFEVAPYATKIDTRRAIEKIFEVHVVKVNITKVRGKMRKIRASRGKTKDRKRAIVTLKEGERIALFE